MGVIEVGMFLCSSSAAFSVASGSPLSRATRKSVSRQTILVVPFGRIFAIGCGFPLLFGLVLLGSLAMCLRIG